MRYEAKGMASRIAMSNNYDFSMALDNSLSDNSSSMEKTKQAWKCLHRWNWENRLLVTDEPVEFVN